MKKLLCAVLALAMLLSLAACGSDTKKTDATTAGTTAAPDEPTEITITDHAGNTVTLPEKIDRIAVWGLYPLPSVLSVFFNSAEKIVAMPEASMAAAKNGLLGKLYPEILNADTASVSGETVNVEALLALKPDVVFYAATDTTAGEALKAAGFTAVAISVNKWQYNCIDTLNNWISLLGKMFQQDEKVATVKEKSEEMVKLVQDRVGKLTEEERARIFILFQYSDQTLQTSGKNFFGQWWCDALNAVNVANELEKENGVPVNLEQIYAWNPDVILVTNFTKVQPENFYNNTAGDDWSGIDAVKNKRVYKLPLGIYRGYMPGADTPVTLLYLAKTVYPDLFTDIDVTAEAKTYYKDVFGIELTDEQITSVFKPVSEAAEGV